MLAALGLADAPGSLAASAGGSNRRAPPAGEAAKPRPDPAAMAKLVERSKQAPVAVIVEFAIDAAMGQAHQPEPTLSAAAASAQRLAIQQVRGGVLARLGGTSYGNVKTFTTMPLMALEVGPEALRRLANDPDVVHIQEDIAVPPYLADSIPLIGADDVFADGFTGAGQVVAILDTGVDADHPFLAGKVVAEACFSTTASNSTSLCPGGVSESTAPGAGRNCPVAIFGCDHGTHVAGVAAGSGRSFSGVARDAGVIAMQVFSRFDGSPCTSSGLPSPCVLSFTSDQIRALEQVLDAEQQLRHRRGQHEPRRWRLQQSLRQRPDQAADRQPARRRHRDRDRERQ